MRLERFHTAPDLIGRRVWLRWDYLLDSLETPGDVPDVVIRRKSRDFEFPPLVPGDPYLVFDSAVFPPAPVPNALAVTDLPDRETYEDGFRIDRQSISVAGIDAGNPLERQRWVRSIYYDDDGVPVRVRTEVLDADDLEATTPIYYELDDGSGAGPDEIDRFRSIAVPGEIHGLNRKLWEIIPEVYKSGDARQLPDANHLPGVPETRQAGGQLRRFVDMFGIGSDFLRNSAEGLALLRDVDTTGPDTLARLGRTIGWEPSDRVPLPQQRNEIATANRLFNVLGTVQSLRGLITHQTGWRTQVAEISQNISLSNRPAATSVFLRRERAGAFGGEWRGADDASDIFAFPSAGAFGGGGVPAVLTSGALEPFPLRAGMELTLSVDGNVPVRVRFGPDDFAQIGAATAVEVADVLNHAFDDLSAQDAAGAVELTTVLTGPEASLVVEPSAQSLLAISDLAEGAIAPVAQGNGNIRVIYRQRTDPGGPAIAPKSDVPGGYRRIFQKSWGHGEWRGERPLPAWTADALDVTAAGLPGDALLALWTTKAGATRFALGNGRAPEPATITSLRSEPYNLVPGAQLTLVTPAGPEVFTVNAVDYAVPAAATAMEVENAMTAQLANVSAAALPDGTLRLRTVATGTAVTLRVDLSTSTAARALGLGARSLRGTGSWNPEMDWQGPLYGPPLWNPVATPTAVADPAGGAFAAWAEHEDGHWQIRQAHWEQRETLSTPAGVATRLGGGAWSIWTIADGLPSDDIRDVARDATGTHWFATAAGAARRQPGGTWTTFTTLDGLASDDIRALVVLPNGDVACATPLGLSEIDPAGAVTTTVAAPGGLPSSDIRALASAGDGALWVATAAGIGRRDRRDRWTAWGVADGLPAVPITSVAVSPAGSVAAGSAAGVSVLDGDTFRLDAADQGLPSATVRDLAYTADGTLLAATASGLGRLGPTEWSAETTADGLPTNDLLSVAERSDGRLLIGTSAGLAISPDVGGSWSLLGVADGLPSATVRTTWSDWSAPAIRASGGGGHVTPHLTVEAGGGAWLFWSMRAAAAADNADDWTLQLSRFDPANSTWGVVQAITTVPPGGTDDRQPWAEPDGGGGVRLFFTTNRQGGRGLGWIQVDPLGVPAALSLLPPETQEAAWPATVAAPDGGAWLFHRADMPLVPAHATLVPEPSEHGRESLRLPDTAALSHRAGARTPVLPHLSRHAMKRRFGDPMVYTPEHPNVADQDTLGNGHLYTRRTLALYMRQSPFGTVVTQEEIARLLQLLNQLKPINLRLVLIVAPDPLTEFLYPPGADIGESWSDNVPIVDILDGLSDSTAVTIPGLGVLISNDAASRTADPLDVATLLRRTWFPDLI